VIKPLLAVAGVALLGTATAAGVYAVASSGGEEEIVQQVETATPNASPSEAPSVVPSPTPTFAATLSPTPPSEPAATPAETTAPPGKAPDGCVSGENAYVDSDGRFAFCYRSDMELATVKTADGIAPTVMHGLDEKNRVVVNLGWGPQHRNITGDPCVDYPPIEKNKRTEDFTISGRIVAACYVDHFDPLRPDVMDYKAIDMEVPTEGGGFVRVSIAYTGPDWTRGGVSVESIGERIVDSLVIN
jgi:hypothetical protein